MRRLGLVVLLALLVFGAGAVAAWSLWHADGEYDHALERYGNDRGEPNVYVDLPDGDAQLALGSPDGHALVVQWRDPDGHGWTAPETVWDDRENLAIENTVRYGGGTAAIVETYTSDVHDDSDGSASYVAVVCRDLTCEATGSRATEAQVTPDGSTAYLGQSVEGVLFWDESDGFHEERWEDHPGFDYHRASPSEPVLAPDGSLRMVGSAPDRGSCTFALYTSAPGSASLTVQDRRTEPLRGNRTSDCRTYLATWSDSWVQVNPSDHRGATFWFVADDGGWTSTTEDASGFDLVDVRRGCCDSSSIGFVHWHDVTFGSPDGQRIQVQSHLLGDEHWSDPVLLEGAPAGARCTWQDGYESGPAGFAVVMTCRDGLAVAASPDLRTWTSTYLPGETGQPLGDGDGLTIDDRLVWTPDGGFQ
ncbi:hypothetical protein [Nocardioides sp. SR21]|uniref:hypothetical protein n=1 Tax=Nocardioides sp. SR21 TaxID=2919501 RepID=UPI001FAAD61D|nr:hypothetical protein [Nocardioides sp. SR21]